MTALAPYPLFRAFTAGSNTSPVRPLVGGKLYTYAAGTTTPKDTFADESGDTANPNPVELDARGEANVWLGDGAYKFVLTDRFGIQQGGAVDNIEAPEKAGAAAAAAAALEMEFAAITLKHADNITEMIASGFGPGSIILTNSYFSGWAATSAGPLGGARYVVVTPAQYAAIRGNNLPPSALGNGGDSAHEVIDFTMTSGNIAMFQHDGRLRAHQAGMRGDGATDDSAACKAAVNWCVRAADVAGGGTVYTPSSGRTFNLHFDPGYYRIQGVYVPGTVHFSGSEVGAYAGAVIQTLTAGNYIFRLGKDWSDSFSNASTFAGLRFRALDIGATSNTASMIDGDETTTGLNSIYFYRCWFQWSEGWMVTVCGGDWKFEGCDFDTSSFGSGVRIGTSIVAAVHTKFIACEWYGIQRKYIECVNASGTLVDGCTAAGQTGQDGCFFWSQDNIHPTPSGSIIGSAFESIPRLVLNNHQLLTFSDNVCINVGAAGSPAIALGGGGTLATINITDNTFLVGSAATCIDAAGTALNTSTITGNKIISNANPGIGLNLPSSNSGSNFGGNLIAGFATPAVINRPIDCNVSLKLTVPGFIPGAIAAGASYTSVALTVPGLTLDRPVTWCLASGAAIPVGIVAYLVVTSTDQLVVRLTNVSGATVTVGSLTMLVMQPPEDAY